MGKHSEIKQLIRSIASPEGGATLFEASVVESKDTECTIKYQGLEHKNVRLVCGFSQSLTSVIVKPAPNSTVLVADLSSGKMRDLVVLMVENAKSITIDEGTKSITKRLDEIEAAINSLKDAFSTWIPVSQDGGAALKTNLQTWLINSLSKNEPTH